MILVHLKRTWQHVLAGQMSAEDATLKAWSGISDRALDKYADVVVGIYDNSVVSVYDIDGTQRDQTTNRVVFVGRPSKKWSFLLGQPNPGRPWGRQGDTRPVQYIATEEVTRGTVAVENTTRGKRAVVDDYVLTVIDDNKAVLVMPPGCTVTIMTR